MGLGGIEPPTSPLSGVRSSHLSYRPGKKAGAPWDETSVLAATQSGGAGRDRTGDLLNANQALCHLSYGPVPQIVGPIRLWTGAARHLNLPHWEQTFVQAPQPQPTSRVCHHLRVALLLEGPVD